MRRDAARLAIDEPFPLAPAFPVPRSHFPGRGSSVTSVMEELDGGTEFSLVSFAFRVSFSLSKNVSRVSIFWYVRGGRITILGAVESCSLKLLRFRESWKIYALQLDFPKDLSSNLLRVFKNSSKLSRWLKIFLSPADPSAVFIYYHSVLTSIA